MICRYIIVYLKRIHPYRWLCAILFLILVLAWSLASGKIVTSNMLDSFLDIFIYHYTDPFLICYYSLFVIIILCSDINSKLGYSQEQQIVIRVLPREQLTKCTVYACATNSVIITMLITCCMTILIIMQYGIIPFSTHKYLSLFAMDHVLSIVGMIFSQILMFCRIFFIILGIAILNILSKNAPGFLFAVAVTQIDWWFYHIFQIEQPWFILPIEHTSILYTEALAPAGSTSVRPNYWFSLLYWQCLILAEIWALRRIIQNKDIDNYI